MKIHNIKPLNMFTCLYGAYPYNSLCLLLMGPLQRFKGLLLTEQKLEIEVLCKRGT